MSSLFNISVNFSELFDRLEEIESYEPDTNADGTAVDSNGEIIPDINAYRGDMEQAWFDTLDGIEGEFSRKAENVAVYIKQLKAEKEAIDAEVKSLRRRAEAKERQLDSLKSYLLECMDRIHITKIDEPRAKISIRNNAESVQIDDTDAFIAWAQTHNRDDLLKYAKPDIRKTEVKEAIKSGAELPGAAVGRTRSLMVK